MLWDVVAFLFCRARCASCDPLGVAKMRKQPYRPVLAPTLSTPPPPPPTRAPRHTVALTLTSTGCSSSPQTQERLGYALPAAAQRRAQAWRECAGSSLASRQCSRRGERGGIRTQAMRRYKLRGCECVAVARCRRPETSVTILSTHRRRNPTLSPPSHHLLTTLSPPSHHPLTIFSPPSHHSLTTLSPPSLTPLSPPHFWVWGVDRSVRHPAAWPQRHPPLTPVINARLAAALAPFHLLLRAHHAV